MRPLSAILIVMLILPESALAQYDIEPFFDHPLRDRDTFYTPPPLPPAITIATYDFEGCSDMGWSSHDLTEQDIHFHVDDFAGMTGYSPITGSKSLWCGERYMSSGEPLCTYMTLPGYGNYWSQYWTTRDCLVASGDVDVSFAATWDTEPSYDATYVEFDKCDDDWQVVGGGPGVFDSFGSSPLTTVTIPAAMHAGSLRIRFRFESNRNFSDEDGLLDTNGAIIIDDLAVTDSGGNIIPTEGFESKNPGDISTSDWEAGARPPRGDFAALFSGGSLLQEDPAHTELSCVWAFINGSTANYGCGGHPSQIAVPFQMNDTPLSNEIRSPWIPFTGPAGYATRFKFRVYTDNPVDNLVFYQWWVRELLFLSSCPSEWRNDGVIYYSDRKRWRTQTVQLTPLLNTTSSSDLIQVALRVVDYSALWGGTVGSGACHSHAPLFDAPSIERVFGRTYVPATMTLFQDRFPEDGTLMGTVRVDGIESDHLSIQIADAGAPIDFHNPNDPNSGPAVYLHVRDLPGKSGGIISGGQDWPAVGSDQFGTIIQMSEGTKPGEYIVDLNDQLYTPGDKIEYYVSSRTADNVLSYWSNFTDEASEVTASQYPMEMQCLPTPASQNLKTALPTAVEFLYVDAYSGLGAQPAIETTLSELGVVFDRFDRNEPLQARQNGLGDLATYDQIAQYNCILWNTGDIYNNVFTDADVDLMLEYLDLKQDGRIFLTGDNVAKALATMQAAATLKSTYFNFTLVSDDHHNVLPAVTPAIVGVGGSPFDGQSALAYVGDEKLSHFDVLSPDGAAFVGMEYEGNPATAALLYQQTNSARTAIAGFSLHTAIDDDTNGQSDRAEILKGVLDFFGKQTTYTGVVILNEIACAFKVAGVEHWLQSLPGSTVGVTLVDETNITFDRYRGAEREHHQNGVHERTTSLKKRDYAVKEIHHKPSRFSLSVARLPA